MTHEELVLECVGLRTQLQEQTSKLSCERRLFTAIIIYPNIPTSGTDTAALVSQGLLTSFTSLDRPVQRDFGDLQCPTNFLN